MRLHKTDQARLALATEKNAGLSLPQRRILILTDGKRSIEDIMTMLGSEILPEIDGLIRSGYLSTAESAPQRPQAVAALGQLWRSVAAKVRQDDVADSPIDPSTAIVSVAATTRAPAPPQQPQSQPQSQPQPQPRKPAPATRRSLAVSKMYVMDLLQLQRDLRMAECRAEIQCADGEVATAVALLDGVRQMLTLVAPSYASRVIARLDETMPEEFLPALRALESEITGKPVLAITNAA